MKFEMKPHSTKTLSFAYGVCDKTFKKWIAPFENQIGKKNGYYYTVTQVKTIIKLLGEPGTTDD